jgi:hypothetical protein
VEFLISLFMKRFYCICGEKLPDDDDDNAAADDIIIQLNSLISICRVNRGARGSVVIKALCCKPEGRGFKS